jgi:hypothetical protein
MTPHPVRLLFVYIGKTWRSLLAASGASTLLGSREQRGCAGISATGRPATPPLGPSSSCRSAVASPSHRMPPLPSSLHHGVSRVPCLHRRCSCGHALIPLGKVSRPLASIAHRSRRPSKRMRRRSWRCERSVWRRGAAVPRVLDVVLPMRGSAGMGRGTVACEARRIPFHPFHHPFTRLKCLKSK